MSSVTGLPVFFTPLRATITAITNANPGVITTAANHEYGDGIQVRIVLPSPGMGMRELNGQLYYINVLSPNTFSVPVDTSNFVSFNPSATSQVPQVIPVGEESNTLEFAVQNGLTPI